MQPGQVVAIVLAIPIVIALISGLIFWLYRRKSREELLSLNQDLKQNVIPSFEGAGEADVQSSNLTKWHPISVIMPTQGDGRNVPHTPAIRPQTPDLLPSHTGTVASTFQKPADKSGLSRLLAERMSQLLKEPTGPPPDYTLDYGYEGRVTDLASLSLGSQSRETVSDKYIAPDLLPSYTRTMTGTFNIPADKTDLGRLLIEMINQVPEEPNGPPPDNTLDYGYEGGVSDAEDLNDAQEEEEDDDVPSDLPSFTSGSQSWENVGAGSRGRDSRGHGTLCRAFDDLDRLPDPGSSPTHLPMPPSFPQPPRPPEEY